MIETYIDLSNIKEFYDFTEDVVFEGGVALNIADKLPSLFKTFNSRINVIRVQIEYDCGIIDFKILQNFPNIEVVVAFGSKLQSFNGLEDVTKLSLLVIDFDRGKKFDYTALSTLSLDKLEINNVSANEKEAISSGLLSKHIKIDGHDSGEVSYLKRTGLEYLEIGRGLFKELDGLQHLNCKRLELYNCSRLVSIISSNILEFDYLSFETCNKLDMDSVSKVIKCTSLRLSACVNAFNFSSLISIEGIEKIVLNNTGVIIDFDNIDFKRSKLIEVYISPLSKSDLIKLKLLSNNIEWRS